MLEQGALHDRVELATIAGSGGDGAVSFRREAFVPRGGPDGGDGGKGGDILFVGNPQLTTLYDLYRLKTLKAHNGENGRGKKQTGKSGDNLVVEIPLGSEVYEKIDGDWQIIADMVKRGQVLVVARGGKGGWGNWRYASATRQAPRYAKPGELGQHKRVKIILKLLADVGLIGLPNVGKSSLLARISQARPKIAEYPFTTLTPNLGVVKYKDKSFVVADIPGLIEGASQGKGLGHQFLQHIERTKILVHLLDATSGDLAKDYKVIRNEIKKYSLKLLKKPEIVVINKIDLDPKVRLRRTLKISAYTNKGLNLLLDRIIEKL